MNFNTILWAFLWSHMVLANPGKHQLENDFEVGTVLFPGTKWCGPGNSAKNYDGLGEYAVEDRCCRAHDNCDYQILAGEKINGFTNVGLFTAMSCDCDNHLKSCLRRANSVPARTIATLYKLSFPECVETIRIHCSLIGNRCVRSDDYVTVSFLTKSNLTTEYETTTTGTTSTARAIDMVKAHNNILGDFRENHRVYSHPLPNYPPPKPLLCCEQNSLDDFHENNHVVLNPQPQYPPPLYPWLHWPQPEPFICCKDE